MIGTCDRQSERIDSPLGLDCNGRESVDKLTEILRTASASGRPVASELLPLVYDELRLLAAKRMSRMEPGQTLQATALVHEAWLRLTRNEEREWNDKAHFFRAAAQAMRHILVDRARARDTQKRGARPEMIDIEGLDIADASVDERVLMVDEMMTKLERDDPDSVRLITLKFFGGLTNKEIAEMDGVTERTVERNWAFVKAKLYRMIQRETGDEA